MGTVDRDEACAGVAGEERTLMKTQCQPWLIRGEEYQIRIGQHLDSTCSAWLAGMAITNLDGGEAILRGVLIDQAALYKNQGDCIQYALTGK